ncbi:MAG: cobalamin-dependent protein [Proteobacteria bacterium]|nr:cobalamin-dependent protein [Pseudomonadota bacterium]
MKQIKAVISKIGLDGHDVGAKIVSAMLRDAGMEVVYLGRFQSPETIFKAVVEEDADVVGISCQSSNHTRLVPKLIDMLKKEGMDNVVVIVGGTIPDPFPDELKALGVDAVIGPGAMSNVIVETITSLVEKKSKRDLNPVREKQI